MVILRQSLLLGAAGVSVLFFCQCQTQRSYGEVRRGSITFDEKAWGGQSGKSDESEIRSKFAERGYTVADDGTLVADKPDLYAGKKAKGLNGMFGTKQARLEKNKAATKEFRTPEYLKRQKYAGYRESDYGNTNAREGNFNRSRDKASVRLFGNRKKIDSSSRIGDHSTGFYREGNQTYATNQDRKGAAGLQNTADAQGSPFKAGYQDTDLSFDDVRRMVDPSDYARAKRLE
ncbi:MAG: hypothetical protein CMO61_06690 [Verrucomicrobiales bacterium]|jgi:hypothetical protein|nr:hypothetical protein [Verrucomicrobiales bacterium]|tara:strand:- start:4454 stop:5149 length:696 start_codon:yes stop_codon:yes gene_type:complete